MSPISRQVLQNLFQQCLNILLSKFYLQDRVWLSQSIAQETFRRSRLTIKDVLKKSKSSNFILQHITSTSIPINFRESGAVLTELTQLINEAISGTTHPLCGHTRQV